MSYIFAVPALASAAYWLLALVAALRRWYEPAPDGFVPPISILKPMHGRDPGLYGALRSHALQQYPEYEILFGFNQPHDPGLEDVRRLMADFPERPIRLIEAINEAPNGKVGVLSRLAAEARYPVLLVNDSDITVEPDYLREIARPLADPSVGVVTCLYRAGSCHWPGRFEALGIATDFAPSVLVSRLLGISHFALGSTMLFRARDLERIGGFDSISTHIADDYELGKRIAALGYRIVLSRQVVETTLQGSAWREVWRHQVRWSRTIRRSQAAGYVGFVITHATFWALVAWAAGAWPAAAAAISIRLLAGISVSSRVLHDTHALLLTPLIPLRDLWGFAIWMAGLAGDTVEWRGKRMRLSRDGRITPI